MPSMFGHVIASTALGYAFFPRYARGRGLLLAAACAIAPDTDVLAFSFGVPYESVWGHRGWTHSLLFAGLLGCAFGLLGFKSPMDRGWAALWFSLSAASHPLLDMLTTGGLGCALWWPFSDERLFFPVRVIRVSPIGVQEFISAWGLRVLLSEGFWIGLPSAVLVSVCWWLRQNEK